MYSIAYETLNDTYIKTFNDINEAYKFIRLIYKLYPQQHPVIVTRTR
jgi:hypothetical protein